VGQYLVLAGIAHVAFAQTEVLGEAVLCDRGACGCKTGAAVACVLGYGTWAAWAAPDRLIAGAGVGKLGVREKKGGVGVEGRAFEK